MMVVPFFVWALLMQGEPAQKVELTRFSDRVVYVKGQTGEESVMFYNNKLALLDAGDKVRQGSGAIGELRFEDDGRVRFFSIARYRIAKVTPEERTLEVERFTRIRIQAKGMVVFLLPGGTRLVVQEGECYVELEDNLFHVRNAGFTEVRLSGHLVEETQELVPAGHQVTIPLFDPDLGEGPEPIVVREVGGFIVKTTGGYRFEEESGVLELSRPGPGEGMAFVAGARVYLKPGERIRFRLKSGR